MHEKRVEIRWSDVDAFGHVNNAVYATYLEECRDEWLDAALGRRRASGASCSRGSRSTSGASCAQDDDACSSRCRLVRIGNSSVTSREEIRTGGELSAEAEAVLVAATAETGRSRPLTEAERDASSVLSTPL